MNIDEDDTRLFRPLEPGEFGIYTELDELPVSGCPVYLMKGVGGICLSGTATVQVFGHRFRIVRGMVLALFPWQLASIKEVSDDFGIRFFRISHDMFTDTLSSLWRPRPAFEIIKVGKMWVKRKTRKNATITLYFNILQSY